MHDTEPNITIEGLIEKHMDKAYSIAYRFTNNENNASDLVQNAFVKVLMNKDKYDQNISFEPWIYTIIRNLYIDSIRKNKEYKFEQLETFENVIHDSTQAIDKKMEQEEVKTVVQKELLTLEPSLRMVVILIDMESYSYEETAEILRWPLGTVCIKLHRARKLLKEKLAHLLEEKNK